LIAAPLITAAACSDDNAMITLKFQTLIAAIVCSVALLTSAAVPEARAGILGFLHRHLFGGSSAERNRQPTAVSRRPSTYRTVVAHSKTGSAGHTKKAARSQRALSEQRLTMRHFPMEAPQHQYFGQQARAYPSFAAHESLAEPPGSAPFHDTTDVLDTAPLLSNMERSASLTRNHNTHRLLDSKDHAFSTRASWYGPKFDGKRTASGERFNQEGLTAASRTLPLGSKVLVANPTTGKCCTVTINDRGPYVAGRDIDLRELVLQGSPQ
jgi:rare lipoprotein A (peptidoglycan hydrolase)